MSFRILLNGANGRMGQETLRALEQESDMSIVSRCDSNDNLKTELQATQPEIAIDFTSPSAVFDNINAFLDAKVYPVVGTTGLSAEQIQLIAKRCEQEKMGCVIAPNFSIAAVLMMRYAQEIAKYLLHAEIIEMHHDAKIDAPSGTALRTAELIAEQRKKQPQLPIAEESIAKGSRGAMHQNIPIHAVRLPGLVANQEVIFGNFGETLSLQHKTINRSCFMPGVILACRQVKNLEKLVHGLDDLL